MTGEIVSAFLFLFIFVLMRKYCGGYHAQTHLQCNFVFALTTLAILLIVKNKFLMDSFVLIITLITSDIIIFWLAPIVNVNKPLVINSDDYVFDIGSNIGKDALIDIAESVQKVE